MIPDEIQTKLWGTRWGNRRSGDGKETRHDKMILFSIMFAIALSLSLSELGPVPGLRNRTGTAGANLGTLPVGLEIVLPLFPSLDALALPGRFLPWFFVCVVSFWLPLFQAQQRQ